MQIKTIVFVLFFYQFGFTQSKLDKLIIDRKNAYNLWKEASEKNSGIFGSKTKEDLAHSNDELLKIILLDNEILEELKNENSLKYSNLQKEYNELSVENADFRNQIKLLKKRLIAEEGYGKNHNEALERIVGDRLLFGSLALVFGILLLLYFFKHKSAKKHIRTLKNQPK